MSCRSGRFYGFKYQQATPLGEPILRNVNPRPADEAEETGHGATVFRFSKQEMPREVSWPVSRNETPAKIVFLFCCLLLACFNSGPMHGASGFWAPCFISGYRGTLKRDCYTAHCSLLPVRCLALLRSFQHRQTLHSAHYTAVPILIPHCAL